MGLTHLSWAAKRALEAKDWQAVATLTQRLRTALQTTPKYINVVCTLLYTEGCLAYHLGDNTKASLLLWHSYFALLYSHPFIAKSLHSNHGTIIPPTLHPLAAFILDKLGDLAETYQSHLMDEIAVAFIRVVTSSKLPLVNVLLKHGASFGSLLPRVRSEVHNSERVKFPLESNDDADREALEATLLKPCRVDQEYEIDHVHLPTSILRLIPTHIADFRLSTSLISEHESLPFEVSAASFAKTREGSHYGVCVQMQHVTSIDHWPAPAEHANKQYADVERGRCIIPGRHFVAVGTYIVHVNAQSDLPSLPQCVTVLPPTANRAPTHMCYSFYDEYLRMPVPYLESFTTRFKVVQIASNCGSMLIILENGDLYGMGNNDCGQLGLGDEKGRSSPTHVKSMLTPVRHVTITTNSSGDVASAAVDKDGGLWMWGHGGHNICAGEAGQKYTTPRCLEAQFGGKLTKVTLGIAYGFAIDEQARLWFWGFSKRWGSQDMHKKYFAAVPTLHPDFLGKRLARVVVASPRTTEMSDFCIFITEEGQAYLWGRFSHGVCNKNYPLPKLKTAWEPITTAVVTVFGVLCLGKDGRTIFAWFPLNPHDKRTDAAPNDFARYLLEQMRRRPGVAYALRSPTFFKLAHVPTEGIVMDMQAVYMGYASDRRTANYDRLLAWTTNGELLQLSPFYSPTWENLAKSMTIPRNEYVAYAVPFVPACRPNKIGVLGCPTYVVFAFQPTDEDKAELEQLRLRVEIDWAKREQVKTVLAEQVTAQSAPVIAVVSLARAVTPTAAVTPSGPMGVLAAPQPASAPALTTSGTMVSLKRGAARAALQTTTATLPVVAPPLAPVSVPLETVPIAAPASASVVVAPAAAPVIPIVSAARPSQAKGQTNLEPYQVISVTQQPSIALAKSAAAPVLAATPSVAQVSVPALAFVQPRVVPALSYPASVSPAQLRAPVPFPQVATSVTEEPVSRAEFEALKVQVAAQQEQIKQLLSCRQ